MATGHASDSCRYIRLGGIARRKLFAFAFAHVNCQTQNFAVIFLGEPLYWNLLAGLALVTLGIVFGVRMQAQRVMAITPDLIADGVDTPRAGA